MQTPFFFVTDFVDVLSFLGLADFFGLAGFLVLGTFASLVAWSMCNDISLIRPYAFQNPGNLLPYIFFSFFFFILTANIFESG